MAILPLPQQIQQYQQQQALNRDQDFFTGLLKHGMNVGEFDMINDEPVFSPGESMPDKTQAWNAFIATKKGRMTPQDLMQFESSYESTKQLRTQNQIKELNKLNLQGARAGDIQDMVEDDPQLYQNLLDMVTELEASGTEEGMAMAAQAMQYLPDKSPGIIDLVEEHPLMTAGSGYLAYKAAQKFGPGLKERFAVDPTAKAKFEAELAKGNYKLDRNGNWIHAKSGNRLGKGHKELARLNKISGAADKRSWKTMLKGRGKTFGPSLGLYMAPTAAEALGVEEGTQKAVSGAAGIGIGGLGLKKFAAAAAARHASPAGATPWGQVALGLIDLVMAYQMLSRADIL